MPQNIPKSMKYVFVLTKMQKNTKIITKCFGCINFDLIMQKVRKMRKTRLSAPEYAKLIRPCGAWQSMSKSTK